MSRNGKKPVSWAAPVKVEHKKNERYIVASGPMGELSLKYSNFVEVLFEGDNSLLVKPLDGSKEAAQMWGTTRALLSNIVEGVGKGFSKKLSIVGVGYRAQASGKVLKLSLGYSHEVVFDVPEGIEITTPKPVELEVRGADKSFVGDVAAKIRAFRPCEPYKGKGIRYEGEKVFLKEGKKK